MIGQVRIGRGRDRHHAARADEQRVAVVRLVHHVFGGDPSAGAGLVLVDDRLAEDFGQLVADEAGEDVVAAAGRERDDDADRLVGIIGRCVLRRRGRRPRPELPNAAPSNAPPSFVILIDVLPDCFLGNQPRPT